MKNPTRHKLREAEYFLSMLKEAYEDDNTFAYNLSAFLSAARSVTFYMRDQYGRRNGLTEWYRPKETEMRADPELVFLNEARVESVHKETVPTRATRQATATARAFIATEKTPQDKQVEQAKAKAPARTGPKTVRRFFAEFENHEVRDFCEKQLAKLAKLVEECEKQFP